MHLSCPSLEHQYCHHFTNKIAQLFTLSFFSWWFSEQQFNCAFVWVWSRRERECSLLCHVVTYLWWREAALVGNSQLFWHQSVVYNISLQQYLLRYILSSVRQVNKTDIESSIFSYFKTYIKVVTSKSCSKVKLKLRSFWKSLWKSFEKSVRNLSKFGAELDRNFSVFCKSIWRLQP